MRIFSLVHQNKPKRTMLLFRVFLFSEWWNLSFRIYIFCTQHIFFFLSFFWEKQHISVFRYIKKRKVPFHIIFINIYTTTANISAILWSPKEEKRKITKNYDYILLLSLSFADLSWTNAFYANWSFDLLIVDFVGLLTRGSSSIKPEKRIMQQ